VRACGWYKFGGPRFERVGVAVGASEEDCGDEETTDYHYLSPNWCDSFTFCSFCFFLFVIFIYLMYDELFLSFFLSFFLYLFIYLFILCWSHCLDIETANKIEEERKRIHTPEVLRYSFSITSFVILSYYLLCIVLTPRKGRRSPCSVTISGR
jgi:hypothetical protein